MTSKFAIRLLAGAALVLGSVVALAQGAQAGIVLSDNFDADAQTLNWLGDGVFSSDPVPSAGIASTDLIGTGFFDLQPGNGNYVDLDGSTGNGNNPAGQLTSLLAFGPGSYSLSFDLAGNLRGAPAQTTDVFLGTQLIASLTPANTDPFALFTFLFTSATGGNLIFVEMGPSDQQGNLLDNVTLATVPEPSTLALVAAVVLSLLGMGVLRRRLV